MAEQKKILLSLPDALLQEVDHYVSSDYGSRSALIREAMQEFVDRRKQMELKEQLKQGYQLMAGLNLEWAEACLEADNTLLFGIEEKLSECE